MSSGCKKLKENLQRIKQKITGDKAQTSRKDASIDFWKENAEQKQDFYCGTLGSRIWEEYKCSEKLFLELKIGFAIFGPPTSLDDVASSYKEPLQQKTIENIVNVIERTSTSESIYLAFIYIIGNLNAEYAEFPIIRLLREIEYVGDPKHSPLFIDILGRVYKNWNNFLKENKFPKGIYCYPRDGFYSRDENGKLQLDYGYSPACSKLNKLVRGLDGVSNLALYGSAAVGVAALAVPVAAPVLLGSAAAGIASGVWSSGRSVGALIDRKLHDQPVALTDEEARQWWLGLATGVLGAAAAGAVHYTQMLARSEQVLGKLPSAIVTAVEATSGGLGILSHAFNIIENKQLTTLNVVQIGLCILFFCHTKIDNLTLMKILKHLQQELLNESRKFDKEHKLFEYLLKEADEKYSKDGVKHLKIIENIDSC